MSRTRRLIVVLVLNLGLVVGLVAVGVTAHSIAVLAEGGDYLLDAAGVGVALRVWLGLREDPCQISRTRPGDGVHHAQRRVAVYPRRDLTFCNS